MCKKCHNDSCCGCSNDQPETNQLTNFEIINLARPGHPLEFLDDAEDIALFDVDTGLGSGIWLGWAISNGNSYTDENTGRSISTYNYFNRTIVGAGDQYEVGDQFGEDSHALTAAENGAHTHTITDSGHTHVVTDPGHSHAITDEGHTHTVTDPGHDHPVTDTHDINKNIPDASFVDASDGVAAGEDLTVPTEWSTQTITHTGSVTADTNTTGITIASEETGITVDSGETGITLATTATGISIASSGAGDAHENRQPSSAVLVVKRIYVPI